MRRKRNYKNVDEPNYANGVIIPPKNNFFPVK
jgi:hypothetical protein